MWVYCIFIVVLVYALYKERQALGCGNFFDGVDCDNPNGKAVIGSMSYPTDSSNEILDKIDFAADYNSRFVKWRSFLLLSVISVIVMWFIIFRRLPSEWELVCGTMVVFIAANAYSSFYKFHLYAHVQKNIDNSTDILRSRV